MMIEIGPNLKEVLINFMNNNVASNSYPGYKLKECFGKILDELAEKVWDEYEYSPIKGECCGATNTVSKVVSCKKYPTKSGYYWFYDSLCKQKRVVYFEHKLNKVYYHGSYYPRYIYTLNEEGSEFKGYFIQPMRRLTI